MLRLIIEVVGIAPGVGEEVSLAKIETDRFDPDYLDAQLGVALDSACRRINSDDPTALRSWQPEVSVVLTADDTTTRPSLHLTFETLQRLAEAGAAFDFDPYV